MRRIFRQGGFLLIVGAILIIIGALLATVVTFLFVARSESGIEHLGGAQALFLAESGREQALRGLVSENTYCSSVSYPNVSFGAGNFSASATLNISARVALGSAVAATDSVIPVSSTAGFAAHGRIRIEDEEINYAALSTSCAPFADPACFTGAWRGVAGTTAAAHAANTSVSQEQCLISSVGSVPDIGSQRTIETARQFIPAMMVYSKGTGTPYFRLWEATAWGPERTALAVSSDIRFLRLVHARTRNEAILVTQDDQGRISTQVWDGAAWGNQAADIADHADIERRGFDVAYETASDRALVVFNSGASATASTRIWDGSSWISAANATLSSTLGFGRPTWIVMAPNPLPDSNEIAVITSSSGNDVYGLRWTGSGWDQMSVTTSWDTSVSTTAREGVGVAYSQLSGQALFVWGDNIFNTLNYRTLSGGTLGGSSTLTLTLGNPNTTVNWIRLAPDPYSDRILCGIQSATRRIVTQSWSGSAWNSDYRSHDTTSEDVDQRNFDIVFETHPTRANKVWIMWGDGGGVTANSCTFPTCAWSSVGLAGDDDTGYVTLFAHPKTGSVFAAIYEHAAAGGGADDLLETHLTLGGTSWPNVSTQVIWAGPTAADPQYQRVDISAGRFLPRVDWPEIFR